MPRILTCCFFVLILAGGFQSAMGQIFPVWQGSGTNWSDGSNWDRTYGYGQLEWKGGGNVTSNNNRSNPESQWRLYFSGMKAYTLTGNAVNLFDFNSTHSWVLSDSTVGQSINLDVNFAATTGNTYGQISARNSGNLVLNNVGITGSQVAELRLAGEGTGSVSINGVLSGSGKSVVIGRKEDGTGLSSTNVFLAGNNTYSGSTSVVAGTVTASNSNAFGITAGGVAVTSGARIQLSGGISVGVEALTLNGSGISSSGALQNSAGNNSWAGAITLGSSSRIASDSGNLTIGGNIDFSNTASLVLDVAGAGDTTLNGNLSNVVDGSQKLNKSGSGLLTLGGTNAGKLMFNLGGGTVSISSAANLGNATGVSSYGDKINFVASSVLRVTESMSLGNTGASNNFGFKIEGGQTATFEVAGTKTLTIDGQIAAISGNGNLTKTGGGTLILTQANSYGGATTVNTGTLLVNSPSSSGTGAGLVSVAAGATLGGSGIIGGATTINGTHAAGNGGTGTQTFSSSLTYVTNSIFSWDLNATTTDPGADTFNSGSYDKVMASGAVTGSSVFTIVLGGNVFSSAFWNTNKSWTDIFTKGAGSYTLQTIFSTFNGSGVASNGLVAGEGQFSFSGDTLTWTAVPEPTSALGGILLAAGMMRRRRG